MPKGISPKAVPSSRLTTANAHVIIDFLEATKKEVGKDLDEHVSDILTAALFKKVYVDEYDRYGGRPFGCMVGLYEFDSSEDDVEWLRLTVDPRDEAVFGWERVISE